MTRLALCFPLVVTLKTGAEDAEGPRALKKPQPKGRVHSVGITQTLRTLRKNTYLHYCQNPSVLTDKQKTKPHAGSHRNVFEKSQNHTELSVWKGTKQAHLGQQNPKSEGTLGSQTARPVLGKLMNDVTSRLVSSERPGLTCQNRQSSSRSCAWMAAIGSQPGRSCTC